MVISDSINNAAFTPVQDVSPLNLRGLDLGIIKPKLSKAQKKMLKGKSCKWRNNYKLLEAANSMTGDLQGNYQFLERLKRGKDQADKRSLLIAVKQGKSRHKTKQR
jgi:hypothetical protein